MTDIPSRSFGSEPKWFCRDDAELLTLFNTTFPIPGQNSWTTFRPSSVICMHVILVLWMMAFRMEEWRRLPNVGKHTGNIEKHMSDLFEWTLTYRESHTPKRSDASPASQDGSEEADMVGTEKSKLTQFQRRSCPLAKRLLWHVRTIPQKD